MFRYLGGILLVLEVSAAVSAAAFFACSFGTSAIAPFLSIPGKHAVHLFFGSIFASSHFECAYDQNKPNNQGEMFEIHHYRLQNGIKYTTSSKQFSSFMSSRRFSKRQFREKIFCVTPPK